MIGWCDEKQLGRNGLDDIVGDVYVIIPNTCWGWHWSHSGGTVFYFKDAKNAVEFKLRFG